MVDAPDLKFDGRNPMRVRIPPLLPYDVERSLTVEPLAVNQEDVGSVPIVQPKFKAEVAQ